MYVILSNVNEDNLTKLDYKIQSTWMLLDSWIVGTPPPPLPIQKRHGGVYQTMSTKKHAKQKYEIEINLST